MNREIKFRGKRKDNGEWVYGYYVYDNYDGKHYIYAKEYGLVSYEVVPKTIGQYIGLKDKNGKEIYESDILSRERKTIINNYHAINIVKVIWDNENLRYWVEDLSNTLDLEYFKIQELKEFEIIGNIYKNPELLTNKN